MNIDRDQNRNPQQQSDRSNEEKKRQDNPFKDAGHDSEKSANVIKEEVESVQEKKEAMTERD